MDRVGPIGRRPRAGRARGDSRVAGAVRGRRSRRRGASRPRSSGRRSASPADRSGAMSRRCVRRGCRAGCERRPRKSASRRSADRPRRRGRSSLGQRRPARSAPPGRRRIPGRPRSPARWPPTPVAARPGWRAPRRCTGRDARLCRCRPRLADAPTTHHSGSKLRHRASRV